MALVEIRTQGNVTHLVLNRPKQLNALSPQLLEMLIDSCKHLGESDSAVVVLSGAGPAFCAGADLPSFAQHLMGPDAHAAADLGRRATEAVASLPQLTIAWIDGVCVGGGLVLASACDLRWSETYSQFSLPELAIGIPVGWGGTARLAEIVGVAMTKALTFEAKPITAETAHAMGLVSQIFASSDAFDEALLRLAEIPRFTLSRTLKQFDAITAKTFDPHDDAQLMVEAIKRPEIVAKLMSAWQNKSQG
jgi:enoyl-CoA hydratase/carnithine racemase